MFNIKKNNPMKIWFVFTSINVINLMMATENIDGISDIKYNSSKIDLKKSEMYANQFQMTGWQDFWVYKLLNNLLNYSTVVIPCFFLVYIVKRRNLLDKASNKCGIKLLRLFVEGRDTLSFEEINMRKSTYNPSSLSSSSSSSSSSSLSSYENKFFVQTLRLCLYSCGLLLSYLIWGIVQERVMVYEYTDNDTKKHRGERFTNSQFIVFANRVLAFAVAIVGNHLLEQPTHRAPFYKYIYCSFSNIMSSWCQYEALKFVSFPVQVLAKTIKVIPVMMMGRLVSRRSYSMFEYVTASMISVGVFVFLISSEDGPSAGSKLYDSRTSISGVIILIGYLMFDSFTSNWQDDLFTKFKVTSLQMMAGVNFFSVLLTLVSLIEQGTFTEALSFASRHPSFTIHVFILSLTSAIGQLFIFATIANFGPATFTIVMTIRQGLAILLSCIIYGHQVTVVGGLGVAIVFASLFIRVYHKQTSAKNKKKKTTTFSDDVMMASSLSKDVIGGEKGVVINLRD